MKASPPLSRRKKAGLHESLARRGRVLVAFSGGKDSFFLLREAVATLGKGHVVACFVETPFISEAARARVDYFRKRIPVPIRVLRLDLLDGPRLRRNPRDRCYVCKRRMFTALKKEAARLGIATVVDGSTASDQAEHRPGRLALERLGIASPLREAGFTSSEIVGELRRQGIEKFYLTSSTCLATRFPYGHRLAAAEILTLGQVEHFLAGRGIYPLRVRYIPDGVRIESGETQMAQVLALKDELLAFCRERGLRFVTVDLGGITSGPWDKIKRR
jgi:pyridinium-3,5-biscarboxylic acid mononucleotide sulfurtransferase